MLFTNRWSMSGASRVQQFAAENATNAPGVSVVARMVTIGKPCARACQGSSRRRSEPFQFYEKFRLGRD